MKITSKISWLLNLVLIGALIYVWKTPHAQEKVSFVPPEIETQKPIPVPEAPVVEAAAAAKPFHWSQLLSTNDYKAFIANLRSSGCPEETVKDIVRGDMERVFSYMRRQQKTNGGDPGLWSVQAQGRATASLLGENLPEKQEVVAEIYHQPSATPAAEPTALATFLREADLTSQGLSEEQKQQIGNLRQSLLEQINRVNQPRGTAAAASSAGTSDGQPSSTAAGSAQFSMDQTGSAATATGNGQLSQGWTDGRPPWYHPPSQKMLMDEEAQSMLGGIFGIGTAVQYDQNQAAHPSPQN